MKRKEALRLGDILDGILQQNNLDIGLDAARAKLAWRETMGEAVDKCTMAVYCDKGTMYVKLSSAVLRNELFMNRSAVIERINAHIGRQVIKNIYFK